jgi:DNA polymerase
MSATLNQVLEDIAAYVQYKLDEGVLHLEVPPEQAARLKSSLKKDAPPSLPPQARPAAPAPAALASAGAAALPADLAGLAKHIAACTKCGLHSARTRTVPGQGNPHPEIMFIGEAPGEDEDLQGLSFVGKAGQLLTKMIEAMGLTRDDVFIGNILKCRPPDNRKPLPEERDACMPYLKAQIAALKPRVIVALGATAAQGLLNTEVSISNLRGRWHTLDGIDLMPTFHPSYLLRAPAAKKEVWEDLQAVLRHLGKPIPERRGN